MYPSCDPDPLPNATRFTVDVSRETRTSAALFSAAITVFVDGVIPDTPAEPHTISGAEGVFVVPMATEPVLFVLSAALTMTLPVEPFTYHALWPAFSPITHSLTCKSVAPLPTACPSWRTRSVHVCPFGTSKMSR